MTGYRPVARSVGMERRPRMTKAYSYLRFSTPEQMKGDSFRRQTKLAEDYARRNDLILDTKTTYQDLGMSAFRGKNSETGRLGDFLEAVNEGIVPKGSVLLVESLDRISRQVARKAVRVLEDIVEAGVDVVTLIDGRRYDKESLDSYDFLMAVLLFIRANEESVTKSRRVGAAWESKRAKAKERPLTARVPAWLELNWTTNRIEVIPERAEVVRRIFDMTVKGIGQHKIAAVLNAEGVPVFGGGSQWHRSYIAKVLKNPAVIGINIPHTLTFDADGKKVRKPQEAVQGYYPSVIDMELWETVKASLGASDKGRKVILSEASPFAGMVQCGLCGAAMTRVNKGQRSTPGYVCTKAKTGKGCQYHSVRQSLMEDVIRQQGSWIAGQYPDPDQDSEQQWQSLSDQLDVIEEQIRTVVDLLIRKEQRGNSEALSERLDLLEREKAAIEKEMGSLNLSRLPAARDRSLTSLAEGNIDGVVLRTLFDRVTLNPVEGLLGLRWRSNPEVVTEVMFRWPGAA